MGEEADARLGSFGPADELGDQHIQVRPLAGWESELAVVTGAIYGVIEGGLLGYMNFSGYDAVIFAIFIVWSVALAIPLGWMAFRGWRGVEFSTIFTAVLLTLWTGLLFLVVKFEGSLPLYVVGLEVLFASVALGVAIGALSGKVANPEVPSPVLAGERFGAVFGVAFGALLAVTMLLYWT